MDHVKISRLMVANRGEIAARIARTCGEMGITSILAHSDEDAASVAARPFNQLISLGGGEIRDTYLNVSRVIDAARTVRADALHPGYGFLSERAELAAACEEAGIIFVGPKTRSIEMMGSKAESRRLMESIGVPVVPGYHGEDQTDSTLMREAESVGFPILVKASAGGGGKGMKIVRSREELQPAIESARREAEKAFGNGRLLIERYVVRPRHVEFQIFGDASGNLVHLFERDCSVQRRHQKIVEESPAPRYPAELRARMAVAAVAAARAVEYQNAGTVEFVVTPEGEFYFLEMNTRLQVEHPVTEAVVGVDLVRAQIEVAQGGALPWTQQQLTQRGHAIEVRVYAEDPDAGFLPQVGRIAVYREPSGAGIRVDSGVGAGSEISVRYDPMLSKVIAYAETRAACIDRLIRALEDYVLLGTTTNLSYLRRIVSHPAYRAGDVSTDFIPQHERDLERQTPDEVISLAAVLGQVAGGSPSSPSRDSSQQKAPSVWESVGSWGR
ncbi:MAG TPA: biotin carboxylase N-terminal domain-containing protein [Thermoanaerobaculia bacterium]|nr:biotin carboxylase N-terminal domain-containing protein [Thermoanaerobaculia bacterium]